VFLFFLLDAEHAVPGQVHRRRAFGWRNLKKIGNRNFEHFGALRALARRKMSPNYMSIEIRTPDFVPECFFNFFLGRKNFSKKVVWTSFGITKSLTAGNLKILVKNS